MRFTLLKLLLLSTIIASGQINKVIENEKATTIGFFLDTYIIDLYDGLDVGASAFYAKDFYNKGRHSFAYMPTVGFLNSENTENRFILGLGVQYRFEVTKRGSFRVNLAGNYILTKFLYDRFEYNAQNEFVKQKSLKSNFGPSIGLQYSYDVFRIKTASFGLSLGYRLIKLDGGKYTRITEGFSPSISLGIICKF